MYVEKLLKEEAKVHEECYKTKKKRYFSALPVGLHGVNRDSFSFRLLCFLPVAADYSWLWQYEHP